MRIVVADDNPKWLEMLVSIVKDKCEVVATAADGKSALQAIYYHKPDVVVLDLGMPGLSGIDITRKVTKDGRKPAVVICSAETAPEIVVAAREGHQAATDSSPMDCE